MKTKKINLILEAAAEGLNISGEEAAAAGFIYEAANGAVTISKYTGDATTLAIPARIDGVPVTAIGHNAFDGCTALTSVTMPASVTEIGGGAFKGCTALTSVTLPASVTAIGISAFFGCPALTSITIPASVTEIGPSAFQECPALASITVAERNANYKSIDGVLFNRDGTTLVRYPGGKKGAYTVPTGVTEIGVGAFSGCTALTGVTLPASVTEIGIFAFDECPALAGITVAKGDANYRSIDGVLFNKDGTTLVQYPGGKKGAYTVPAGVTKIGVRAFSHCPALTGITVAEGNANYRSIDSVLFNKDGTTLFRYPGGKKGAYTVPAGVTEISVGAFEGCTALTSVTLPASVTAIGISAFFGCIALTSINVAEESADYKSIDGVLFNKDGTELLLYPGGKKGAYTMPAGVTEISVGVFDGCTALTSVTLPAGVTSARAPMTLEFQSCPALTSITVAEGDANYRSIDGVLFNKDGTELLLYPGGKKGAYIVPADVTEISVMAFSVCSGLTSVTVPASVTEIYEGTFDGCTALKKVTLSRKTHVSRAFPYGVTLNYID